MRCAGAIFLILGICGLVIVSAMFYVTKLSAYEVRLMFLYTQTNTLCTIILYYSTIVHYGNQKIMRFIEAQDKFRYYNNYNDYMTGVHIIII